MGIPLELSNDELSEGLKLIGFETKFIRAFLKIGNRINT